MRRADWDITPEWGGTGRLSKFAGRRKTKEWNLTGILFTAERAERYELVNRLCEPEDLDQEVAALVEVMLSKNRQTTTVTKYFLDKGADLDMWSSVFFEGAPQRPKFGQGIKDFVHKESRDERRKLLVDFWQD